MKLKSKLKLYEEFVNVTRQVNDSNATKTDVAIDKVSVDKENTIRTEISKDVDSILNNLIELSDRIGESTEVDTLFEELFEALSISDLNEGIMDIIKSPIKYMKISKAMKGYQKALVSQAINDLDFAKKKEASDVDTEDKTPEMKKKLEVLKQANLAKNQALKDEATGYSDRMSELAKGDEGLGTVVSLGKAKSKIAAAKTAMKAASGEESKSLKLEIRELEDRIANDEKELKDYAKTNQKDGEPIDKDKEAAAAQSAAQLGGSDDNEEGKPAKAAKAAKTEPTSTTEPTEDDKKAQEKEKLEKAKTDAKAKLDAVPETASPKERAVVKVEYLKAQLALAQLNGDDAETIEKLNTDIKTENAIMNLKVIGQSNGGAKESNQTDLSFDTLMIEASVSGLMASDEEEDGYKYLKAQAKKLGVKVTVNKDPYGDGYDELSFSGDKGAVMKLAGISGHAEDITDGAYELEESVKTIKLDESMTIAEKFAKLMNK